MNGMSQAQLADKSGIRQPTICRYLSGRIVNPSLTHLERLEKALPKLHSIRKRKTAA